MTDEHDFFVPERIDEQIDHLSRRDMCYRLSYPSEGASARSHARQVREARSVYRIEQELQGPSRAEVRLVEDLSSYYQEEQQEDVLSLERAWKDVLPHLHGSSSSRSSPLDSRTARQAETLSAGEERYHCSPLLNNQAEVRDRREAGRHRRYVFDQAFEPVTKEHTWSLSALLVALLLLLLAGGARTLLRLCRRTRARDSPWPDNR